jgi:hypothetical protein
MNKQVFSLAAQPGNQEMKHLQRRHAREILSDFPTAKVQDIRVEREEERRDVHTLSCGHEHPRAVVRLWDSAVQVWSKMHALHRASARV